jgi:uncharacterized protein (DUF2237 family)
VVGNSLGRVEELGLDVPTTGRIVLGELDGDSVTGICIPLGCVEGCAEELGANVACADMVGAKLETDARQAGTSVATSQVTRHSLPPLKHRDPGISLESRFGPSVISTPPQRVLTSSSLTKLFAAV